MLLLGLELLQEVLCFQARKQLLSLSKERWATKRGLGQGLPRQALKRGLDIRVSFARGGLHWCFLAGGAGVVLRRSCLRLLGLSVLALLRSCLLNLDGSILLRSGRSLNRRHFGTGHIIRWSWCWGCWSFGGRRWSGWSWRCFFRLCLRLRLGLFLGDRSLLLLSLGLLVLGLLLLLWSWFHQIRAITRALLRGGGRGLLCLLAMALDHFAAQTLTET
mmetsp:Transcript_117339/g.278641  ORF Transcript_117339/g.278641 Transcript_117339/m.278641 type:complete len:218 (-) Transcript_117339:302-955(-)